MKSLLLCTFLFFAISASAEQSAFVLSPNLPTSVTPIREAEYLEEPSGTRTLQQVKGETFKPIAELKAPEKGKTYWTRLKLKSALASDTTYIISATWWDYVEPWVLRADGKVEKLRATGLLGQVDASETARENFYSVLNIAKGEELTLYARLASEWHFRLPTGAVITLRREAAYIESREFPTYMDGIIFGILFGLACYNLIIAITTRDRSYYWYCSYMLGLAISLMGQMGSFANRITQYFLPDQPGIGLWVKRIDDVVLWICLVFFVRSFLDTRRHLPRLDKWLLLLVAYFILGNVLFTFGNAVNGLFQTEILAVSILIAAIVRYRQGYQPARFLIAGHTILGLGLLLQASTTYYQLNLLAFLGSSGMGSYLRGNQLWVAGCIEAVLFSLALANRLKSLQQEKQQLIEEQKQKLELEVNERTRELSDEKDKSDRLLANILPSSIADELKEKGFAQPQRYEEVSVLFTDFKGFTNTVAMLPAKKVVEELNDIFQHFDDIIDECGIEKIKTIGDSYMIVGGLPKEIPNHAERCVEAAQKMLAYIEERNISSALKWQMRTGIHSGSVVAGIVGKRKFTYDVWGDTVNIASRMESAGEPGRINISAYTYDLIKQRYEGEYRGKVDVKGKGEVDMYFVRLADINFPVIEVT